MNSLPFTTKKINIVFPHNQLSIQKSIHWPAFGINVLAHFNQVFFLNIIFDWLLNFYGNWNVIRKPLVLPDFVNFPTTIVDLLLKAYDSVQFSLLVVWFHYILIDLTRILFDIKKLFKDIFLLLICLSKLTLRNDCTLKMSFITKILLILLFLLIGSNFIFLQSLRNLIKLFLTDNSECIERSDIVTLDLSISGSKVKVKNAIAKFISQFSVRH